MARLLYSEKEVFDSFDQIKDGSNIAISGFNMATTPEYLIIKLYEHYKKTGHPKDLFVIADSLPGVPGRAIDYVSEKLYREDDSDFMKGILIPYMGFAPWLQRLCVEDRLETYSFSIGTVVGWFREVAAGRPGIMTKTGLGTYLDPREDKGAMNDKARKASRCYSQLVTVNGEEFLLYRAPKPDVSLVRGTTADEIGNITMENESIFGTVLNMTQSAKAYPNPGISFAQVKRVARFGSLNAKNVEIPGPILDYAVVSPESFEWQTAAKEYDPRISGAVIPPESQEGGVKGEVTYRNVIERRLALEIVKLINKMGRPIVMSLGVGIPSAMPGILHQEGLSELTYSTIESGLWGGIPLADENFGASIGPFAAIPMPDQFIIYEGGINDMAALGFMEIDTDGDVNPSILADRMPGPGGFPAICAGAPRIFFSGGFTAGKSNIKVRNGKLVISEDGEITKFVSGVYKVLFSGTQAMKNNKEVLYVTERAVFKLVYNGIELVEYAPGVDIDRDITGRMDFRPKISNDLKEMDRRIFSKRIMGLKREIKI
ncbi:CoA-transferase [uncultured archaeon]|nr:CoA-transferase [uncultured archaeon]